MVYKLTYFNLRSRAEPIRLLFAHAGIEFEDVRIENTWDILKEKTPWGKLPVLEDGDFVLSESLVILEYLGRKHGYGGDTDMDTAKCNEYVRSMADLREAYMDYVFETSQDKKEEKLEKYLEVTTPFYLSKFENILMASGKYLLGNKMTFADFYVAHIVQAQILVYPETVQHYSALRKHQDTVFEAPGVKEWVAKRPLTLR